MYTLWEVISGSSLSGQYTSHVVGSDQRLITVAQYASHVVGSDQRLITVAQYTSHVVGSDQWLTTVGAVYLTCCWK